MEISQDDRYRKDEVFIDISNEVKKYRTLLDKYSRSVSHFCVRCKSDQCKCDDQCVIYTNTRKAQPHKVVKEKQTCSYHDYMYLNLYCGDCRIPLCAQCEIENVKPHKCVTTMPKAKEFTSQIDLLIQKVEIGLHTAEHIIQDTNTTANKIRSDIEEHTNQIHDSYHVILEQIKTQQNIHLTTLKEQSQEIECIIAKTKEKQIILQTSLQQIKLNCEQLKDKEIIYVKDIKSLVDAVALICRRPPELSWKLNTKWKEIDVDFKDVELTIHSADIPRLEKDSEPAAITKYYTRYQGHNISSLVLYKGHLIVSHYDHDVIYVYDEHMELGCSTKVSGMHDAWSLCLVNIDAGSEYIVVGDCSGRCLWWLKIHEYTGGIKLVVEKKQALMYRPWCVQSSSTGEVIVASYSDRQLYLHGLRDHQVRCVNVHSVMPCVAVEDPSGGYVIGDQNDQMIWVSCEGDVTQQYKDQPPVSVHHITRYGRDWLITDYNNNCVHLVTENGRHGGHLLTWLHGVSQPRCISVDAIHCLWLAHSGKDGKRQLMKVEYPSSSVNSITLISTLPKIRP